MAELVNLILELPLYIVQFIYIYQKNVKHTHTILNSGLVFNPAKDLQFILLSKLLKIKETCHPLPLFPVILPSKMLQRQSLNHRISPTNLISRFPIMLTRFLPPSQPFTRTLPHRFFSVQLVQFILYQIHISNVSFNPFFLLLAQC